MFLRMKPMSLQNDAQKNRNIKRDIKISIIVLPVISLLFGVIISFLFTNYENIFKTDLTKVIFLGGVVMPTVILFPSLALFVKKLIKDLESL